MLKVPRGLKAQGQFCPVQTWGFYKKGMALALGGVHGWDSMFPSSAQVYKVPFSTLSPGEVQWPYCPLQVDLHSDAMAANQQIWFGHHEPGRQPNQTGELSLQPLPRAHGYQKQRSTLPRLERACMASCQSTCKGILHGHTPLPAELHVACTRCLTRSCLL